MSSHQSEFEHALTPPHVYRSARHVAIDVLTPILLNSGSISTHLSKNISSVSIDHQARLKELCFGVCRWFPKLNSIALRMLKHPFEPKDMDVYATLLLALYELDYMRTPDHAVVNEAVESCKEMNKDWAANIINAVLRRYLRDGFSVLESISDMPSVEFSHPKWLVKRFKKNWPAQFDDIIEANNTHPPMCLRVNQRLVSRGTENELLEKEGIETQFGRFAESSLYLKKPLSVNQLPTFEKGHLSVQDESAQLSAFLLNPQENERVLDACAAPGGKTGHLLEYANIDLTAVEMESWRLEKIEQNLSRLNLNAKLICSDVADLNNWWDGVLFDKILLDVPCSATGVIRRNPDIKVNRKPNDIETLIVIQKRLLTEVWKTLAVGGQLLYATCSLLPEENETQIGDFLKNHSEAQELPLPLSIDCGIKVSHGRQLFPQLNGHDGFYYCLLQKTS